MMQESGSSKRAKRGGSFSRKQARDSAKATNLDLADVFRGSVLYSMRATVDREAAWMCIGQSAAAQGACHLFHTALRTPRFRAVCSFDDDLSGFSWFLRLAGVAVPATARFDGGTGGVPC